MLVGSAVGMTPPPLFTHFLAGLDADRQYHEQRQRPEQGIDGEDRGQLHRDQSSLTTDTSTIGFLPVHAVAVRRAASRRARSAERRVGKECVSTGKSRGATYH